MHILWIELKMSNHKLNLRSIAELIYGFSDSVCSLNGMNFIF